MKETKKIAVTQPNYFPWLGYFDLMDQVDLWISLDDVKLSKRSFVVRNKILSSQNKPTWITINLQNKSTKNNLNQSHLAQNSWWKDHLNKIKAYYYKTPYFDKYFGEIKKMIVPRNGEMLTDYNERIVKKLMELLGIKTKFKRASEISLREREEIQDRMISLCKQFGGDSYYNFKNGVEAGLYKPQKFTDAKITLFKQDYQHPRYDQHQVALEDNVNFSSHMSILDLLFNEGEKSLSIIRSGRKWINMDEGLHYD